jgi:hypothetical protein
MAGLREQQGAMKGGLRTWLCRVSARRRNSWGGTRFEFQVVAFVF